MSEIKILKDSEPTIVSYPRVTGGGESLYGGGVSWDFVRIPSGGSIDSVEARVTTPGYTQPTEDWTAGTYDSLQGDVEAYAYEGDTSVEISITGGGSNTEKGVLYWIENDENGDHVLVECQKGATQYIYTKEPLPCDVAAGSRFYGFYGSIQLTAEQTSQIGRGVIQWRMSINGIFYVWNQLIDIVRSYAHSTLNPSSLSIAYPVIKNLRSASDNNLEEVIAAAWAHEVVPWLHSQKIREENIASVEVLEPLHALACVLHMARQREDVSADFYARLSDRYEQLKKTIADSVDWLTVNQESETPIVAQENTRSTGSTILLRR